MSPRIAQEKQQTLRSQRQNRSHVRCPGALIAEGQKVLIFSQFVGMLEILQHHLNEQKIPLYYLDGSTENRGCLVQDFQKHEGSAVFLISLKAGGAGLNLTAASYVILFDPWWNPAVEAQAIDRTHRIGQERTVIAYRLIAKDTIEEKIRHLQKEKAQLFQDVLGEENFAKALSLDDFHYLLTEK
ncbi:MAG: SWF/SNF helicase family protein [Blastochloris sp.]|nr:SWF/SNF helicase family protein [Blastochloris sp.]